VDTLIKLNAQPIEGLDDVVLGTGDKAGLVGVLNAENHVAAMLTSKEVVVQSRADTTNVEGTGRAGSETNAYFSHVMSYLLLFQKVE
jgi:hypothetical protein